MGHPEEEVTKLTGNYTVMKKMLCHQLFRMYIMTSSVAKKKTTTDSDEENITNKSDTDEEIEVITSSSTTAIGPPVESGKELRREVRGIDIGQEIMPGRTRQQTRDAIQLVEENFDNFYHDGALMSAVVNTNKNDKPRNFQEVWYIQKKDKIGERQYARNLKT